MINYPKKNNYYVGSMLEALQHIYDTQCIKMRARKYDEEYDGVKYSAADLLGSSSGESTKKTTKKSRSKKSGK